MVSTDSPAAASPALHDRNPGGATPFWRLLAAESRTALHPRHAVMAGLLIGMGLLLAGWLPHWPETIYRFFTRIFHLDGWSDIVLINNFTGLLFFLYWLGVVDVLRVYVQPFEERYLDLLLAKPIARRDYLLARLGPRLLILLAIGVIAASAHAIAMVALGLPLDGRAYAGAVAIVLAVTLCLVALVNVLLVSVRDSFTALVGAFVPFMLAMLPGVVYLYRPDVYDAAPALADVLVFPANLLWHDAVMTHWSPIIVLVLALATLVLVALAGRCLAQRDVP
jgi:hypothetical protein